LRLGFGPQAHDLLGFDVRQPLQSSAAGSRGKLFAFTASGMLVTAAVHVRYPLHGGR
jgi:hypothetical protein